MATDNNYVYPTIVAMTSILENKNPETKIDFYIMLSGDFDKSSRDKIEFLKNKYECSISFIDMKDKLKDLFIDRHITTATYYRLLLPDLLPNLDKVLYMDVDTITQQDLSDLFNINIDDYYLAGCKDTGILWVLDSCTDYVKQFGKEDCLKNYVSAGILLFNLKKMREDNLLKQFVDVASSHDFECHDQDTLNWVCHDKIKRINKIFNSTPFLIENIKNQVIIHYAATKPWNVHKMKHADIWWNYAQKSGFATEIKEKFPDRSKKRKKFSREPLNKMQKKIKKVA